MGKLDLKPLSHENEDGGQPFAPPRPTKHPLHCDWTERTQIIFCDEGPKALVHDTEKREVGTGLMKK